MRIDALTNLQQVYGVGKDIQTVKAAVKAAPDVRANKVADIKKQIEAGTYNVSGESFADKLLAKYNEAAGLS